VESHLGVDQAKHRIETRFELEPERGANDGGTREPFFDEDLAGAPFRLLEDRAKQRRKRPAIDEAAFVEQLADARVIEIRFDAVHEAPREIDAMAPAGARALRLDELENAARLGAMERAQEIAEGREREAPGQVHGLRK
jgi:hypothetical protein